MTIQRFKFSIGFRGKPKSLGQSRGQTLNTTVKPHIPDLFLEDGSILSSCGTERIYLKRKAVHKNRCDWKFPEPFWMKQRAAYENTSKE
jgi:hypothetical protein